MDKKELKAILSTIVLLFAASTRVSLCEMVNDKY